MLVTKANFQYQFHSENAIKLLEVLKEGTHKV